MGYIDLKICAQAEWMFMSADVIAVMSEA